MHTLYIDAIDALIRWTDLPGDGPPLVCLPALSFPATMNFAELAGQTALRGRRAILIDYPGSGASEPARDFDHTPGAHAGVVGRVLDHLDLPPAVLFGHSMGGSVAVALARQRPDLVRSLVVAEGNLTPGGGAASRGIVAHDLAGFRATGFAALLSQVRQSGRAGHDFDAFLHAAWQHADAGALHGNAHGLVHLDPTLDADFKSMGLPRTFVYGEKSLAHGAGSPDVPDPATLLPHGVEIAVIPGAGHFMTRDNPAAVAAVLAGILAA